MTVEEQKTKKVIEMSERIAELEKENAEAKEIMQLFLDANNELDMINAQRKAEKFLRESKE